MSTTTTGGPVTGTRPTRARQLTAVAVLSLLLAALPATAWADHGDRGRGDGGRESRGQFDRQRDGGEPRMRLDTGAARLGFRDDTARDDDHRDRDGRWATERREARQDRDRRDRDRDEPRRRAERDDDDGGFVSAASVQVGRDRSRDEAREDQRRSDRRAKEQAEQARQQQAREREEARASAARERQEAEERAARERRAERADRQSRLELDRLIWGASTEAQRQADELERDLRRWLETPADEGTADEPSVTPDQEPQQDEAEVATSVAAPPPPPADAPAEPTAVTAAPDSQTPVAAPAESDLLTHERSVVDRTFRAGGALLRDTGRAVVSAIPPRARTFSIPLGLVAALGGYLVVQRRFRPGVLPMSAAAVPDQEGARERHRL
ncbi:MAG TPA: hypothetical protein VK906_01530 [Egicoccus sp.]|nr:hypothetical protein [Egicoccus sp.]HSK21821.1 hypothetical protein [Egicoccus sp.]